MWNLSLTPRPADVDINPNILPHTSVLQGSHIDIDNDAPICTGVTSTSQENLACLKSVYSEAAATSPGEVGSAVYLVDAEAGRRHEVGIQGRRVFRGEQAYAGGGRGRARRGGRSHGRGGRTEASAGELRPSDNKSQEW